MKPKHFQAAMRILTRIIQCAHCGNNNFQTSNIHLLQQIEEPEDGVMNLLVHSDCVSCQASIITSIFLDNGEMMGTTIKTDLTASDASRLLKTSPISTDDVISIHAGIEGLGEQISLLSSAKKRKHLLA